MIWRIYFTDVESVQYTEKRQKGVIITIEMKKGSRVTAFYADSDTSTMKWFDYCALLFKIPKYAIPKILPTENVALHQGITQYSNLRDAGIAIAIIL